MRLNEIEFNESKPVDGYGPGFFRIGGTRYDSAVTVLPIGIALWDGYKDMATLVGAASEIDVLFVGTGATISPIPDDFRTALESAGVGVEIMASPTACRTFNILLSEGRRIGLALIPV